MSSRDRRRYGRDFDWARGKGYSPMELASGGRAARQTEISGIVRKLLPASVVIADGTTGEKIDPETGEILKTERRVQLPRSQIAFEGLMPGDQPEIGKVYTIRLPEWLARDRGLI